MSSMEMNRIKNRAVELNLTMVAVDCSHTSYLPINIATNYALLIEDDTLLASVTAKMLEAGVSIIGHVESD